MADRSWVMDAWMNGAAAYDAYGTAVGRRNRRTHDDQPMPTWDELDVAIQSAWVMAARAAIARHEAAETEGS